MPRPFVCSSLLRRNPGFSGRRCVLRVPCNGGDAIDELCLVEDVGVVEHAVFERYYDELRVLEMRAQHLTDVLGVG